MKIFRSSLVLAAFGFLALGCGTEGPLGSDPASTIGGENSLETVNFNQAYGGLAFEDEAAAFGDPALKASLELEDELALSFADDEDSVRDRDPEFDRPEVIRTWVRILWGNHQGRPDSVNCNDERPHREPVVWDGTLGISGMNRLAVKRPLLFERATDSLHMTRTPPHIRWRSQTRWHVDGLLVCVLSRPDSTGMPTGELEFRTGPLSESIPVADLVAGLDKTIRVDDAGNAVSFQAFKPEPKDECANGFLGGVWMSALEGNGGQFRGRLAMANGNFRAWLGGRYGVNDAGERVFAGKILSREGHILGLMEGKWEPAGDGSGMGRFVGHWASRNGERMGRLGGGYTSAAEGHWGFFRGRWAENCSLDDLSDTQL